MDTASEQSKVVSYEITLCLDNVLNQTFLKFNLKTITLLSSALLDTKGSYFNQTGNVHIINTTMSRVKILASWTLLSGHTM